MTKQFTVGKWAVTFSTRARRPWSRIHSWRDRDTTCRMWVWGRFSLELEDWTAEVYPICACCGSADIGEVSYGDEGWTVCQSCQAVEQGYDYVNLIQYEAAQ